MLVFLGPYLNGSLPVFMEKLYPSTQCYSASQPIPLDLWNQVSVQLKVNHDYEQRLKLCAREREEQLRFPREGGTFASLFLPPTFFHPAFFWGG
jgi:hypothetical protein